MAIQCIDISLYLVQVPQLGLTICGHTFKFAECIFDFLEITEEELL